MSELVATKKQKVDEIDWENMDVSDIKLCSILDASCESCAG